MEEPVLTMETTRLHAEPGGQAQLSVKLRNAGRLVESFRMDVVGLDPSWWQVHPPELSIYPGAEEPAVVVLTPPVNAQASDEALPFAVRAVSTLDAARAVVEEGDLEIGRIENLQAAITPVTSRGRWSGRHVLTYTNGGNSPVELGLSASDQDEELGFRLEPRRVSLPVGSSATARLRVRPRNPFLRGAPVHRPFQVVGQSVGVVAPSGTSHMAAARVEGPDQSRPVLTGAIQQLPILSRGAVALGALLVAAIAGLVVVLVKTSNVVGARTSDTLPEAPIGLIADAVDAGLITLRWQPTDRAEQYRVERVDEANDSVVLQVIEVTGGATAFDAKVDKPLTRACYRVVAVHGTLLSRPSEMRCVTTPDGVVLSASPTATNAPPTGDTAPSPLGANELGPAPPAPGPTVPAPPGPSAPAPPGPTPPTPPGPTGFGTPPPPAGLAAARRNMSGTTGIALTWSAPAASGWSITGYQVKTGTSTSTVAGATEFFDADSTRYCTLGISYQVTTTATLAGTATSVESEPATVIVTDPVDCTFPSRIDSATPNPDGSVTVQAVCQTDLRGPGQITEVAVLFDDVVMQTQQCQEGADPMHTDDPHTFVVTGLAPATTYAVTTRTTSPSGSKISDARLVTTV
jgi:hypothetical protein